MTSNMQVCERCGHPIPTHQTPAEHAVICDAGGEEAGCENCGMIDVPLKDGFCAGCICERCGRNAGTVGRSMNDMGWCEDCESLTHMAEAEAAKAIASGAVPPLRKIA